MRTVQDHPLWSAPKKFRKSLGRANPHLQASQGSLHFSLFRGRLRAGPRNPRVDLLTSHINRPSRLLKVWLLRLAETLPCVVLELIVYAAHSLKPDGFAVAYDPPPPVICLSTPFVGRLVRRSGCGATKLRMPPSRATGFLSQARSCRLCVLMVRCASAGGPPLGNTVGSLYDNVVIYARVKGLSPAENECDDQ